MTAIDMPPSRPTLRLGEAAHLRVLARLGLVSAAAPPVADTQPSHLCAPLQDEVRAFRARLAEAIPVIASLDREPTKPLKIGIREDLLARFPDASADTVRRFLSTYCGSPSYRRLCIVGATRFNLDGEPCGSVTEREAGYAAKPRHEAVRPTITDGGPPDVAEEAASPADGPL